MLDPFSREYLSAPREIPEIVRRLAAYAYVTAEDYDRMLNARYGYTPRRDEVHPDARSASQIHAGAVWRGVASIAEALGVSSQEVRLVRGRIRDYDDALRHYSPVGGRHLPDRLDMNLQRAPRVGRRHGRVGLRGGRVAPDRGRGRRARREPHRALPRRGDLRVTVDPHAYLGFGLVFNREQHEAAFLAVTEQATIEDAATTFERRYAVKVVVTDDRVYVVHPEHYYAASWEPTRCGVLLALSATWRPLGYAGAALDFLPTGDRLLHWLLWADTTTIED